MSDILFDVELVSDWRIFSPNLSSTDRKSEI